MGSSNYKRIVHVSVADPNHLIGGQGVAVYNLAKIQAQLGNEVFWISPIIRNESECAKSDAASGVSVIKLKYSNEPVLTLFGSDDLSQRNRVLFGDVFVAFLIRTFNPRTTIIHLHGFIEAPKRAKTLIAAGFRVVSQFHMLLSDREKHCGGDADRIATLEAWERQAIMANHSIIVNSEVMKEVLLRLAPDFKGQLKVIGNGVPDEDFRVQTLTKAIEPSVVSYGRISPEKGFELLLRAATRLPDVRFHIFGQTDDALRKRKDYAAYLRQLSSSCSNVDLDLSPEGLWDGKRRDALDRAWIGVMPSFYEPFGLVLLEMMAKRLPVISTLTYGARDILACRVVGKSPNGILVNPTEGDIISSIRWLLNHSEDSGEMGENGYRRAHTFYRIAHTEKAVRFAYEALFV